MKKILLLSFFGFLIYSCSSTKIDKNKIRYFDENNVEIRKSKFDRKRYTRKFLSITGDSTNHKKLTLSEQRGTIKNRPLLESLLEKEIDNKIDSNKPIVIIYHSGKDSCNRSATTNQEWIKNWYGQLEDGLNQIAQVKPIYIYKDNNGLEKDVGILTWFKDPEETIERLFFKDDYPCGSFVVISKDGDYISYFGEQGKENVWEATQLMNK